MSNLKKTLLLSLGFGLTACSHVLSPMPPTDTDIEESIATANDWVEKQKWRKANNILVSVKKRDQDSASLNEAIDDIKDKELQTIHQAKILELLERSDWLSRSYQLQQHIVNSNQFNLWAIIRLKWLGYRQEKAASRLLEYGHIAAGQGDYAIARRCYMAIRKLPLPDSFDNSYRSLGLSIAGYEFQKPSNMKWNYLRLFENEFLMGDKFDFQTFSVLGQNQSRQVPVNQSMVASRKSGLVKKIQRSLRYRDVITTRRLVNRLKRFSILTEEESGLVKEAEHFVVAQGHLLDQQAEQLYGDGYIAAANGIWATLLEVDSTNLDWQNKYLRSQKVLTNLQQLRHLVIE